MKQILFVFLVIILAACVQTPSQQSASTQAEFPTNIPSATTAPTDTPRPTLTTTLTPTDTPKPSDTPTVTPSPTIASPQIIADFLVDPKVHYFDNFDDDNLSKWEYSQGRVTSSDGSVRIEGKSYWDTSLCLRSKINEGNGVIFRYRFSKLSEFEFFFQTGLWQNPSFRRFGVYAGTTPRTNVWVGKKGPGGKVLHGILNSRIDTWQLLTMAVDKNGNFLALIGDPENPSQYKFLREELGEKFKGNKWDFCVQANSGLIEVDDFYQISFDELK